MKAPAIDLNAPSYVNVTQYGAKGDGQADNTQAFQTALTAMGNAGGGIVFVPHGLYKFTGSITIPIAVTLEGVFQSVMSTPSWNGAAPTSGSVLMPTANQGNANATPFITVSHNAVVRGVIIYHPNQAVNTTPIAFPWSISLNGDNTAVTDIELLNSYLGIKAVNAARHYIARVQGQPIKTGILVDQIYDIGRIEDVHWNPWWSTQPVFFNWILDNGEAFIFARADWEYVLNTFAYGYKIGYHFNDQGNGATNGNFLGIGADCTQISVYVEATQSPGLEITNGEFTSFCGGLNTTFVINSGRVKCSNCAVWGPSTVVALVNVTSSSQYASLAFAESTFQMQSCTAAGPYAMNIIGGGQSTSFALHNCEFLLDCPQVTLGKGVTQAVIVGNIWKGKERIQNNSTGNIQIGLNSASA